MFATKEYNGEGSVSDSTIITSSSISAGNVQKQLSNKRKKCFDCNFQKSLLSKSKQSCTKHSRSNSKLQPTYNVGRKSSQCWDKQLRRQSMMPNSHINSSPVQYGDRKSLISMRNEFLRNENRGKGSTSRRNNLENKVQSIYPVVTTQTLQDPLVKHDTFPFKGTPSGNLKLSPSQVVYQSKNLSIVAADPGSVVLNISESNNTMETESVKRPESDNWNTTCLYTRVGVGSKNAFESGISDTVSESEGDFMNPNLRDKPSEISLAKMGYIVDNCLDWTKHKLPEKSELQKLLLRNVLEKINPDFEVKFGSSGYKCHRIVLQCYCSEFMQNSRSVMAMALPESEVSKEVFTQIYKWMLHLGADSFKLLRRDNILDIYKAANFLKIHELRDQCFAFIDSTDIFFEDKAFLLYLAARKYNNRTVMEQMIPRVQRFFLTLVSSKEFVEFSCEEICTFLQSNYICIHCEMEVFMAGVRWLDHDWTKRKQHAVQVMSCVRFGFIDPRVLITMRRNPQCPEFLRIASNPEVSKMIDDGIALSLLKISYENGSNEESQSLMKKLGLNNPIPRNWAGTDKNYQSYSEFLQDLHVYRSKQRLDVKLSKVKLKLESVNEDDFLSSAVLTPATQQRITKMAGGSALMRCLPQLEPKELNLLKKMICGDESLMEVKAMNIKSKLCSMEEGEYKDVSNQKYNKEKKPLVKGRQLTPIKILDRDEAATKIQRYYRQYNRSKSRMKVHPKVHLSGQRLNKSVKSMSNPALPVYLMQSGFMNRMENETSKSLLPSKESLLVFGGVNPFEEIDGYNSGSQIYQYMSRSNSWQVYGQMPEPRHYHSVLYFQRRIYIAGGKDPGKESGDTGAISKQVWEFDLNNSVWSLISDMKYPRRSFGFVACNNGLYVLGGRDDQERILSYVERYDFELEEWVEVLPMQEQRAGLAASEFNSRIWVAGGLVDNTNIATKSVEYYDFQYNSWTQVSSLRYTLAYGVMLPIDNYLFLVGGAIGLQGIHSSGSGRQVNVWDPDSQDWVLATMMCKPRHAHAATCLKGDTPQSNYMLVLGGMSTKHNSALDRVECWSIHDDHWITGIAHLPQPLAGHVALALPSNVLV